MTDSRPGPGLVVSEEDYVRCIRCGLCSYTCPTYRVLRTQAGSPRGRVALMRAASRGDLDITPGYSRAIYRCTLCGACAGVCPSGVQVDELLLRARADVAGRGLLPPELARLGQTITRSHNLSGEDNSLRLIWAENLPRRPRGSRKRQAEIVYFAGCVGSFYPRSYGIPQATVRILEAAGVDYALLGSEEWCCGFPLLANGQRAAAREAILHNVEAVRAAGARQVVFTCPSCFAVWKHEYPHVAGPAMVDLEVRHISELLADLLEQGRLRLRRVVRSVTYHDPCDLGRNGSRRGVIVEAPRRVLQAIPGLALVEMCDNRANSLCCGGGGNLEAYEPGLVQAASDRRLSQALDTGAGTIVSACQQCERTLAAAARRQKAHVRIVDITELVAGALE